ncbi:MAG: Maf family protein, partial [Planctomycetota bacterium]
MTTVRSDPDGPAADRRDAGGPIVLASRSPRRRSLLGMVVPVERLRILPPADAEEESLESLTTWREIEAAMLRIAAAKRDDVLARIAAGDRPVDAPTEQLAGRWSAIVAADTAVIAGSADGPG